MELYLPIAEMPVGILMMLAMGGAVGFIGGLFGIGGGFLLTPLLIFSGIPPAVAVASVTPVSSPPITPPKPSTRASSAITHISASTS